MTIKRRTLTFYKFCETGIKPWNRTAGALPTLGRARPAVLLAPGLYCAATWKRRPAEHLGVSVSALSLLSQPLWLSNPSGQVE